MFKKSSESKSSSLTPFTVAVLIIILLTAAAIGIKNRLTPAPKETQTDFSFQAGKSASNEDMLAKLLDKVAKHIIINRDAKPTLAVVENADLLRMNNPAFYKDVQNGDSVLLWKDRAIVYSSERDIIVAATYIPTSVTTSTSDIRATSTQAEKVSEVTAVTSTPEMEKPVIEVRNGSGVVGRGKTVAERLKTEGLDVLPAKDAKVRTPYEKTLIILEQGKVFPDSLKVLQGVISGELVEIPVAEAPMKGEILIIVGQDYIP